MPITKSAKKSLKVSRTKAEQNRKREVLLSKALKQVNAENVSNAVSLIDKAAKSGIIHENKAARMKSQLAKKFGTPKVTKATPKKEAIKAKPAKAEAKKIVVKKTVKKATPKAKK